MFEDFTLISNPTDLIEFANDMKISAVGEKYELGKQRGYSKTVEEANTVANNPEFRAKVRQSQNVRGILMKTDGVVIGDENGNETSVQGLPVTLALTAEILDKDHEQWHLSISIPIMTEEGPLRVPDQFATAISRAFFSDKATEFDAGSAYKNVRHFKMEKLIIT